MRRAPRFSAAACALVVSLGACASADDQDEPQVASTGAESEDGSSSPDKKDRPSRSGSDDKQKNASRDGEGGDKKPRSGNANSDDGGGSEPDPGDETQEGNEDDSSSAAYPAAGRYSYAQSGWEEFCQAGSCDRQDLPDTQMVASKVDGRSGGATTVVTEAQSSEGRVTRTTFRFTDDAALITKVYVRVQYEGFTFENTYDPQPPVESLRFPMQVRAEWSGSWEARTSGDYSISIPGREQVSVGGRAVNAFRVVTATDFRGEFQGHADVTVWIDPATKAIVKSVGDMRLNTAFGGYNTSFEIALRDAPGY